MRETQIIQQAVPEISENLWTCSHCGKAVSDRGETGIGGSPFSGWYSLQTVVGGTTLEALSLDSTWDFCSRTCLCEYVRGPKTVGSIDVEALKRERDQAVRSENDCRQIITTYIEEVDGLTKDVEECQRVLGVVEKALEDCRRVVENEIRGREVFKRSTDALPDLLTGCVSGGGILEALEELKKLKKTPQ